MTTAGWTFLALSWGAIICLCLFCFRHMLRQQGKR